MESLYVKIAWTEPSDLRAAPVAAYKIKIADKTGEFKEDPVNCNGGSD